MINFCFECKYFNDNKCLKDNSKVDESYPYCPYGYKDNDVDLADRIKTEMEIMTCQQQ